MKFNKTYIYISLFIFQLEILIAFFVRDAFIRPFVGDLLATSLLFFIFRIFIKNSYYRVSIGVLLFSFLIEILQYFNFITFAGLENNQFAKITLGATFDPLDLLAYAMGVVLGTFLDKNLSKKSSQNLP